MIRVVVVDDQPTVRQGLQMRLALEADIDVVGEAGDGAAAVNVAAALRPDVVLMDVEMPHGDGITATAALRASIPHCAVVMLSLHDDAQTQARARAAGAAAFVAKHDGETTLLAAIRQAAVH
jgi:DNA-binding NarL/FixJ family response regulator